MTCILLASACGCCWHFAMRLAISVAMQLFEPHSSCRLHEREACHPVAVFTSTVAGLQQCRPSSKLLCRVLCFTAMCTWQPYKPGRSCKGVTRPATLLVAPYPVLCCLKACGRPKSNAPTYMRGCSVHCAVGISCMQQLRAHGMHAGHHLSSCKWLPAWCCKVHQLISPEMGVTCAALQDACCCCMHRHAGCNTTWHV